MPVHRMEQMHARLECAHHASSGLLEHAVGNVIEQVAFEFKVDAEVDMRPVTNSRECPAIGEMLERPVDTVDQNLSGPVQRNMTDKAFLKRTKANGEVSDYLVLARAPDSRTGAPGDEAGIIGDISHDFEKLVGSIGECRLLRMSRHITPFDSFAISCLGLYGSSCQLCHSRPGTLCRAKQVG